MERFVTKRNNMLKLIKRKIITLYDKAELYYQDVELKSGIMDYEKMKYMPDELKILQEHTLNFQISQGTNVIEPDSIRFNFKTKKR
jgi:hypothetical protein